MDTKNAVKANFISMLLVSDVGGYEGVECCLVYQEHIRLYIRILTEISRLKANLVPDILVEYSREKAMCKASRCESTVMRVGR